MLFRIKARLRLIFNHGEELNRRIDIESELFKMATGKKPLPSPYDCRIMAIKLGTPRKYWREEWKK